MMIKPIVATARRSSVKIAVCVAFVSIAAVCTGVSYAQNAAAPAAVVAAAQADDERLDLARQLSEEMLRQMNVSKMFDAMTGNMKAIFLETSRKQEPTKPDEYHDKVATVVVRESAALQKELTEKMMPKMAVAIRNLYATRFTADELREILAYSRSPVAKKQVQISLAELPALMTPMFSEMAAEAPKMAQRLQSALAREGIVLKR